MLHEGREEFLTDKPPFEVAAHMQTTYRALARLCYESSEEQRRCAIPDEDNTAQLRRPSYGAVQENESVRLAFLFPPRRQREERAAGSN